MQGARTIEENNSLCVEDNACRRSTVFLCVYINVHEDSSDNTTKPSSTLITQAHSEYV